MSGYYSNRQLLTSAFYNGQFVFKGYINGNVMHDSDFVTLTVNTSPVDAIVTFFDYGFGQVNGHSITVKKGTSLRYTANKDNYFMYTSPTITVNNTQAVSVTLSEQYTCTINPTPSDATVILDAGDPQYVQVSNSIKVPYGTLVNYNVSKTGYVTSTGFVAVTNNEPTPIVLTNLVTLTISPDPSDANVTLTSANPDYIQSGKSITVPNGTNVTYTVSKQYYITVTQTVSVTFTRSINVQLTADYYTPSVNEVICNLTGSSKKDDNTLYAPGRYRVQVAPGDSHLEGTDFTLVSNMDHIETLTEPFMVRAYCGSSGTNNVPGTNPYSGPFKVNTASGSACNGIDVNHIFGAGGAQDYQYDSIFGNCYIAGGGNCLGDGCINHYFADIPLGAGSCCHLLPINGVFGTNYLRAYHCTSAGTAVGEISVGGAYGGGAGAKGYRGGNSPYGNGGTAGGYIYQHNAGTGIGAGGKTSTINVNGNASTVYVGAGAYYNGTTWIDEPGNGTNSGSSYIKITYLGQS